MLDPVDALQALTSRSEDIKDVIVSICITTRADATASPRYGGIYRTPGDGLCRPAAACATGCCGIPSRSSMSRRSCATSIVSASPSMQARAKSRLMSPVHGSAVIPTACRWCGLGTERGPVVLASDAAHYYADLHRQPVSDRPDFGDMATGWETVERLAGMPIASSPGIPGSCAKIPRASDKVTPSLCPRRRRFVLVE